MVSWFTEGGGRSHTNHVCEGASDLVHLTPRPWRPVEGNAEVPSVCYRPEPPGALVLTCLQPACSPLVRPA